MSTRAVALLLCPSSSLTLFILDIFKWFHWTYAPWYMSLLYMYLPFPILLLIVLIFYVWLVKSFYNALWCFFPTVGQLYTYPVQDTPSPFLWCMSNACLLTLWLYYNCLAMFMHMHEALCSFWLQWFFYYFLLYHHPTFAMSMITKTQCMILTCVYFTITCFAPWVDCFKFAIKDFFLLLLSTTWS